MKKLLLLMFLGSILNAQEIKFIVTIDSELSTQGVEGLIKESLSMDQLNLIDVKEYKEESEAIYNGSVEDFLTYYFSGIKSRNLNTSYSYLTDEYKKRTNGKHAYINWWNSVESVTVEKIDVIDPYIEANEKQVEVTLSFVMDDRRVITEEALFLMVYNREMGS